MTYGGRRGVGSHLAFSRNSTPTVSPHYFISPHEGYSKEVLAGRKAGFVYPIRQYLQSRAWLPEGIKLNEKMTAHQNAARRLKALLRRTHFPVVRLKEINASSGASGTGVSNTCNPWDGISGGDPRAALIIMHWTLLELSQLFAVMLLDLHCGGLQSLTDYKFVARVFTILHKEFNCRPQLTAEQFLSHGFAEVKMRLLADVVEIVMRTHCALAQKTDADGDAPPNSASSNHGSRNIAPAPAQAGVLGIGGGGRFWSSQREGSSQGPADVVPPSPPHVHSPSLTGEGPFANVSCGGAGAGVGAVTNCNRLQSLSSPSPMSEEQNAPPPSLIHEGHIDRRAHFSRDRASAWTRSSMDGVQDPVATARPVGRSPLGPRPAQAPPHFSAHPRGALDREAAMSAATGGATAASVNLLLPSRQVPSPCGAQSDWHAVQNVFGSPNGLHVSVPPGMSIPLSPRSMPSVPEARLRSATGGSAVVAAAAGAIGADMVTKADITTSSNPTYSLELADTGVASGRLADVVRPQPSDEARRMGVVPGKGAGEEGNNTRDVDRVAATLSVALAQFQRQMESLLERHSRALDDRISGIEEMLLARLTILETKVQALDHRAPVRT